MPIIILIHVFHDLFSFLNRNLFSKNFTETQLNFLWSELSISICVHDLIDFLKNDSLIIIKKLRPNNGEHNLLSLSLMLLELFETLKAPFGDQVDSFILCKLLNHIFRCFGNEWIFKSLLSTISCAHLAKQTL